jgi:hypothetical protein
MSQLAVRGDQYSCLVRLGYVPFLMARFHIEGSSAVPLIWDNGVFDPLRGQDLRYRNVKSISARRAASRHGLDGLVQVGARLSRHGEDPGVGKRFDDRPMSLRAFAGSVVCKGRQSENVTDVSRAPRSACGCARRVPVGREFPKHFDSAIVSFAFNDQQQVFARIPASADCEL